ncbi:MAG: hypothetical protein JHC33_09265 [Ignisphaera sp.]|nr:hypothetical protein [Ignisphaera sp.]
MASESISIAIIVIASIILAAMVSVALFAQWGVLDSSMRLMLRNAQERLETGASIAQVALNTSGTTKYFVIYAKNTGSRALSLNEIELIDVYLKDSNKVILATYSSNGGANKWNFTETVPDNVWSVGETIIIKVYNATSLSTPVTVTLVLPNGVSAEYTYTG